MSTVFARRRANADPSLRHPAAGKVALLSAIAGVVLAIAWSYTFVDSVIGENVAGSLLGEDAKHMTITGIGTGALFALVSGLAGTFTACNAAAVAAFAPMAELGSRPTAGTPRGSMLRPLLAPVGWLTLGMTLVAATYGFVGVVFSEHLPQLSTGTTAGVPDRIIQASLVFGVIGLALTSLGLSGLGLLPDPLRRRPATRVFILGCLIGGFLIGRPFPLFNKLFVWAAEQDSPLLGAAIFALQSLGNVAFMVLVYAALAFVTRGRALTWIAGDGRRAQAIAGAMLVGLGVFTVVYWDVRVPAIFGFGWFPTLPYS